MLLKTSAALFFALAASAQPPADGSFITVDPGAPLLHRPPVLHPGGTNGTVIVDATLNALGEVTDARVVSGPDQLRKSVLMNVLSWHYASQPAPPTSVRINVTFTMRTLNIGGDAPQAAPRPTITFTGARGARAGGPVAVPAPPGGRGGPAAPASPLTISTLRFDGLSPELTALLQQALGVKAGDTVSDPASLIATVAAVDQHLRARFENTGAATTLSFALQPQEQFTVVHPQGAGLAAVRISGAAANAQVVTRVQPVYPPAAKQARVEGIVILDVSIATDGAVKELTVVSGHTLLQQAAMDAVRQWVFRPAMLNGTPVETRTQTEINFTLQ